MKYYLIAGEASGDLHGAGVVAALRQQDEQAECQAWGGDLMQAAGAKVVKHYRDHAFMGIGQVIWNIFKILGNFKTCKQDILEFKPDALILIDYSGFNLRIAKWAKTQQIRVFYYISPQIWATREKRVETIKKCVDKLFVILPFEQEFYRKHGYEVEYVGHPLLDVVGRFVPNPNFRAENGLDERPIVALLAGSRRQEIQKMLPLMLSVANLYPDYQFVVAGAPSWTTEFYAPFLANYPNVKLVQQKTYDLLSNSHAALVTSGTATLETALFRVPQVVCYKASAFLYWIVKRIIKIPYISLVNLIANREIVRELIQNDLNTNNLQIELNKLLSPEYRTTLQENYQQLCDKLGKEGAANRVAKAIISEISE